ncbi:MAG: deoxyribodipyrimidine photo-lyase [Bdellovibrionales bacterium]|nr:deoxyribodipyrimidine photo-lyase [Bdellovibrionales bacterium]
MSNYGIHWFRRDLRVAGNQALQSHWKANQGRVLGLFCFDKAFLSRPDFSVNRFQLFIDSLYELKMELRELGSDLLFLDVGPEKSFPKLIKALDKQGQLPHLFTWNRDYEPFARKRDRAIEELMMDFGVPTETFRDHLLIEPQELEKSPGEGYQVYSPFARKWLEIYQKPDIQRRIQMQKAGLSYLQKRLKGDVAPVFNFTWEELFDGKIPFDDWLEDYRKKNQEKVTVPIPPAGSLNAFKKLKEFKRKVSDYGDQRDVPILEGTSQLSMHLKSGSITIPQIIAFFQLKAYKKKKTGEDIFLSELIWREFYYHILYRHPRVENEAFLEKYKDIEWENNEDRFMAWKEGKTGFPIVDAGMRELKSTGWMHNRVRMIVASFLTKDLLIDWRWGEKYFMDQLLDGDLAPNNGGWQWAASTGCDPQPYFRIFNPWLQSKKFDPQGDYIKKFVPELKDLPAKQLHEPIENHPTYPRPIVDHSEQREKALALYKFEQA